MARATEPSGRAVSPNKMGERLGFFSAAPRRRLLLLLLCSLPCDLIFLLGCSPAPVVLSAPAPKVPPPTLVRQQISGVLSSEECKNGWDDNANGLIDEGCAVDQGPVQVALSWDDPQVDLDLLVVGPDRELARPLEATSAGLTLSGDCPGKESGCEGNTFEHAVLKEPRSPPGRFWVKVVLDSAERPEPVRARLGVRSPSGTMAFRLAFFKAGQEVALHFDVSERKPKAAAFSKTQAGQ